MIISPVWQMALAWTLSEVGVQALLCIDGVNDAFSNNLESCGDLDYNR